MDQTSYNYCALPLAAYACRPDQSQGRLYAEAESVHRTCFQRDRDRIIHCSAFRRLKNKTQVFVAHEGDDYRTRLTHTLEVAQIARSLARALMVNEDLAETVALAHDLGHPPFAHAGEEGLKAAMTKVGGFDHNDQSLRVLVHLERKYPDWPGLNLTWETLEGVVKHNGPVTGKLPVTLTGLQKQTDLRLKTYATIEAQVAALADDIAYNNHDVEDGLAAGLFDLADLESLSLLSRVMADVRAKWPDLSRHLFIQEMIREMIGAMVEDVLNEAKRRLEALNPQNPDDVRHAGKPMVAFSDSMLVQVNDLRAFLFDRMYRHHKVHRMYRAGYRIVHDIYQAFIDDYRLLPDRWRAPEGAGKTEQARLIADYIANMTDRQAILEHDRLFHFHSVFQ
ncbi:MAG: deoxyguanosinetriphosphate triphosphohydrolase [Rhodospirillales bacterium]|nr:deoxyguanosinetriphosphate triphosphohydrolase [Rhodospirillales bacterium]